MRIDVISIFPEYLSPLKLSLLGKAQEKSILNIEVHDLRAFTSGNHKSVDDTPYGGGAGMVMSAQPWADAIDSVLRLNSQTNNQVTSAENIQSDLIILTPAGRKFTQKLATKFSKGQHLIFACGRYEGIDARVSDYYRSQSNIKVHEVSIGDYVLAGGEVAAMVMIEAITRLIPGVIGNPQSLDEESHSMSDGSLLEYPAYTKPSNWRGLEVPQILLSGNHAEIAKWRSEQAKLRTKRFTEE
jgi:tRNA (guanine37-N1)-methyltransferase